jgi:DNA primase
MRSLEEKLKSFLDRYGVYYSHGPQSFIINCPSCSKESHCYVRKEDGRTICFKCGSHWDWRGFVAQTARCDLTEAHEILFGTGSGDMFQHMDESLFESDEKLKIKPDKQILLPLDFMPVWNSEEGMEYLQKRGVDETLIEEYNIRYHGPMNAVVFPVWKDGATYGWQARRIAPKEEEIRLISAKYFRKANFLLNYDNAKHQKDLILTEGPFDCLHTDVDDLGAVCSFGKLVSFQQIKLILDSKAENVYLGLDADAAVQVYQVLSKIGAEKKVFRVRPPVHREDFGEATPDEVREAVKDAVSMPSHVAMLEVHFK